MEIEKMNSSLKELTFEEASGINGGESLWYWLAYGIGATARGLEAFADGAESGKKHFYK